MRTIQIPKRAGSYRTVVAPSRGERRRLRALLPRLEALAMLADVDGVAHGFTPARSPVTNAQAHIGYQITLSWDLASCFDRLTPDVVRVPLPDECYHQGVARQGLPTSPAVCNLALAPLDRQIMSIVDTARFAGLRAVYTRYADDLAISCDEERLALLLAERVPALCAAHGTPVNPRKTTVQYARAGRRHITGVAVDDSGIHPTRASKRRLRAARHQGRRDAARGLAEWCRLRAPNTLRWIEERIDSTDADTQTLVALVSAQHTDTRRQHHT